MTADTESPLAAERMGATSREKIEPGALKAVSTQAETASHIVGIGSSAGGVESLVELISRIPPDTRCGYVIIQHLSPGFESVLPEILSRQTRHKVEVAAEGALVTAGSVHMIPPGKLLTIFRGRLIIEERKESDSHSFFPIDYFFTSLAKDCHKRAIAVIISGTGTDGAEGVRQVKKNGGHVVVQSPDTARFSGMPRAAVATNSFDIVADLEDISQKVSGIASEDTSPLPLVSPSSTSARVFDKLTFAIKNQFSLDLDFYQEGVVRRRIHKRKRIVGCKSDVDYVRHASETPTELLALRDELVMRTSHFHSFPDALEALHELVFPNLLNREVDRRTIRIWVVGCSTGEDAYSIGFALAHWLTTQGNALEFKIFATDIDEKALKIASRAVYPEHNVDHLPAEWQKNYLRFADDHAFVKSEIRDRVTFATHNVMSGTPFPKIDLIFCPHLIHLLKAKARNSILKAFQFSLAHRGYLLISKNESIPRKNQNFHALSDDASLYRCVNPARSFSGAGSVLAPPSRGTVTSRVEGLISDRRVTESTLAMELYETIARFHMAPSVVFTESLEIKFYFGAIRDYLLPFSGRISHGVSQVFPSSTAHTLENLMRQVNTDTRSIKERHASQQELVQGRLVKLVVTEISVSASSEKMFLATFTPVDSAAHPSDPSAISQAKISEIQTLNEEIQRLTAELVSSREEKMRAIGQLESSNEQLRMANEELQTGSEELQSTNEELQSVNEELYTVNAECQLRITELSEMNNDMQNFYDVSEIGTLFVDKDYCIRKFSPLAQKVFKLIPDDIGRPIGHFSTDFDLDFQAAIQRVCEEFTTFQGELTSRHGADYLLRIAPYRSDDHRIRGAVLVLIDVGSLKQAKRALDNTNEDLLFVQKRCSDIVLQLDGDGKITASNRHDISGGAPSQSNLFAKGVDFFQTIVASDRSRARRRMQNLLLSPTHECRLRLHHITVPNSQKRVVWHFRAQLDDQKNLRSYVAVGKPEDS